MIASDLKYGGFSAWKHGCASMMWHRQTPSLELWCLGSEDLGRLVVPDWLPSHQWLLSNVLRWKIA